jgi:hypothetical protein
MPMRLWKYLFLWRRPPAQEACHIFLGEICPGMTFDTPEDWVQIYRGVGSMDLIECVEMGS